MRSAFALRIISGIRFFIRDSEKPAELVGAKPLHLLMQTALPLKSPTGAFIAAQTRAFLNPLFTGGGVTVNCICNSNRHLTIAAPSVKMRLERSAELVGAKPLHLLTQTALPLKSPTGAFIATLRSANAVAPNAKL